MPRPDHYVYVSREQLEAAAERVQQGEQPWKRAYERAMKDAQRALNQRPRSVVDDGAPHWDDPNQFGQDDDRHDYHAAIDMTEAIRDCALAYWFTSEDTYAVQAIDLLFHWCLDTETGMNPNGNIADNGTSIELWITIPTLWYAAALLTGHPYWVEKTGDDLEAQFRDWVRSFVESLPEPGYHQGNNMWGWRIATIAGAASYLDDRDLLEHACCMWRARCETEAQGKDNPRPWTQYRPFGPDRGALKAELKRKDGFDYHVYGMKALTMTAEIARLQDIDLYGYNAPTDPHDGSTLKKLFNFMSTYMLSPSEWKWGKGPKGLRNREMDTYASLFELAYSHWEDDTYLEVVESVGRPCYDIRLLGWTSLTHANRFELTDDS